MIEAQQAPGEDCNSPLNSACQRTTLDVMANGYLAAKSEHGVTGEQAERDFQAAFQSSHFESRLYLLSNRRTMLDIIAFGYISAKREHNTTIYRAIDAFRRAFQSEGIDEERIRTAYYRTQGDWKKGNC